MSLLHLVDADGNLKDTDDICRYLVHTVGDSEQAFHEKGVDYHVVCIFGGQSSGKSTLLNHLFGTPFALLDARVRRGQTTQGGFLSRAETIPGKSSSLSPSEKQGADPLLLVMDLEGTDGLERGDNQSFERQLSLFGLSVADVLIINMWAVDVGRHNAANLSLLRTIFEMNLHLFHHEGYKKDEKPTLLVVLRDFVAESHLPTLETLRKSFQVIWDGIKKPEAFADATLEDLFHWKCFFLPHYELQRPVFDDKLNALRTWFNVPTADDYLFADSKMLRGVPLEMLPSYLSSCWSTIRSSRELDIPTQREMLAKHRCGEVSAQALVVFEERKTDLCAKVQEGDVILKFTEKVNTAMDEAEKYFYGLTELYSAPVTREFGSQLHQKLVENGMKAVDMYAQRVTAELIGGLESRMYYAMDSAIQTIIRSGIESELEMATSINHNGTREGGVDSGRNRGQAPAVRGENAIAINNAAYQCAVILFWERIAKGIQEIILQMSDMEPPPEEIFNRFTSLVEEDAAVRSSVCAAVAKELVERLQHRCSSMAANASDTLHRYFERALTHRGDGQVRLLRSTAGLEKLVPRAKQGAVFLLGALLYFRIEIRLAGLPSGSTGDEMASLSQRLQARKVIVAVRENNDEKKFFLRGTTVHQVPVYPSGCRMVSAGGGGLFTGEPRPGVCQEGVLLTAPMVMHAYQQFNERADTTVHSKMMIIEAGRLNVPFWAYIVVLLLSMNEIMYVLSSPSLLILLVIAIILFGRKYIASMWDEFQEVGPPWLTSGLTVFFTVIRNTFGPLAEAVHGDRSTKEGAKCEASAGHRSRKKIKGE